MSVPINLEKLQQAIDDAHKDLEQQVIASKRSVKIFKYDYKRVSQQFEEELKKIHNDQIPHVPRALRECVNAAQKLQDAAERLSGAVTAMSHAKAYMTFENLRKMQLPQFCEFTKYVTALIRDYEEGASFPEIGITLASNLGTTTLRAQGGAVSFVVEEVCDAHVQARYGCALSSRSMSWEAMAAVCDKIACGEITDEAQIGMYSGNSVISAMPVLTELYKSFNAFTSGKCVPFQDEIESSMDEDLTETISSDSN